MKLLNTVAISVLALASSMANATYTSSVVKHPSGLSILNSSVVQFSNYDGTPASFTGTISKGFLGGLSAATEGTISFTYLGKESWNSIKLNFNGMSIWDPSRDGDPSLFGKTLSGSVSKGLVDFSFSDLTNGVTFKNGRLGSMMFSQDITTSKFGKFDFLLGFNDKGVPGDLKDADFDDFAIGVKFTPAIPEPSTYLLMGMGLVGLMALKRKQRAV